MATEAVPASDPHRRQAAHLYGLIVSGAVLATAHDDFRLVRVAILLLATLAIYWAAETYVHWIAARTLVQRDLTRHERRHDHRGRMASGRGLCRAADLPGRRGGAGGRDRRWRST